MSFLLLPVAYGLTSFGLVLIARVTRSHYYYDDDDILYYIVCYVLLLL